MTPKTICALLLPVTLATTVALGSPAGELDPSFGDHGRVLLRAAPFEELIGRDVHVDPRNGSLTVVADGYFAGGGDRLLRFNSDGSLDASFGDQGVALLHFGDDDLNVGDVQWLDDGRLLLAGAMNVYGTPDNVIHGSALLARMHADGTADESFGSNGRAIFDMGGVYEGISNILLQADGRIVVVATSQRDDRIDRVLVGFTPDGLIDPDFGDAATPGTGVIDFAGIEATPAAVVQQADGKFLLCGNATLDIGSPDRNRILAIRIGSDGRQDPAFGSNGLALIGGWTDSIVVNACQELADGHLVFAGTYGRDERQRAAVWRITPDGRLDAGFGTNGMMVLDTDTPSSVSAMTVMTDGMLAIAGSQWKPSDTWLRGVNAWLWWSDLLVSRLDPTSGEIDRTFGDRGVTKVDLGTGEYTSGGSSAGITQQPDGKLVVIGSTGDWYDWYPVFSVAMARVDPYGSGSNGWASLIETSLRSPAAGGDLVLHVRRTGGSTGALSVDYRTVADTATAGEDYVETGGTVFWPDGDMSEKEISISALDSGPRTSAEIFTVELSNSSGGLGMDRAAVIISESGTSGGNSGTPPVVVIGGNNNGGGGAIGIELWLLSLLVLAYRGCRRRM